MIAIALAAQAADLLTYLAGAADHVEANPLANALAVWGPLAILALKCSLLSVALLACRRLSRPVVGLSVIAAAGTIGAVANLVA